MSAENSPREQIPLYINGALSTDERHSFETALKQNQDLKREYLEFHEIESTFDRFEDVSEQHLEQIFKTILNNTQDMHLTAGRTSPPLKPKLVSNAKNRETTRPPTVEPIAVTEAKSAPAPEPTLVESKPEPKPEPKPESKPESKPEPKAESKPDPEPSTDSEDSPIDLEIKLDGDSDADNIRMDEENAFFGFLSTARFAWTVAALQFVLLLIVVFFTAPLTQNTNISSKDAGQISGVTTYNVVFADNATQKEIRELLVKLDIQIANGPTSIGLYTIFVKGSKDDVAKTFNKLKNSRLILLAEPSFI